MEVGAGRAGSIDASGGPLWIESGCLSTLYSGRDCAWSNQVAWSFASGFDLVLFIDVWDGAPHFFSYM